MRQLRQYYPHVDWMKDGTDRNEKAGTGLEYSREAIFLGGGFQSYESFLVLQ